MNARPVGLTLVALLVATSASPLRAATEPVDMAKRAEELKNLSWGMFICWSFSTFSGKEWTPGRHGRELLQSHRLRHRPVGAHGQGSRAWATSCFSRNTTTASASGIRKTTDRKVTKSPLGRDVLAELKKSCDKYGIKLALYFSEGDWTWPGAVDGKGGKRRRHESGNEESPAEGTAHAVRPGRIHLVRPCRGRRRPEPHGHHRVVQIASSPAASSDSTMATRRARISGSAKWAGPVRWTTMPPPDRT